MSWFRRIAERMIEAARDQGDLDDLPGAGKPLPESAERGIDALEAAGYRLMKQAGALPPEVILRKRAAEEMAALKAEADPEARKRIMAKLADTQMRLAMMSERRRGLC